MEIISELCDSVSLLHTLTVSLALGVCVQRVPLFFPSGRIPSPLTYLALGIILLLQHGGHLILKEAQLLIDLLQEYLPLGRV